METHYTSNDTIIDCSSLSRSFKIHKKSPGLSGTISSFFNRKYEVNHAISNIDLKVNKGEIVGLLGPNGAGKTTLMKMMSGIVPPSSGNIEVLGTKPFDRKIEFRKSIGLVMGQKSQLLWDIPAHDTLRLIASMYDIDRKEANKRIKWFADMLSVNNLLEVNIRKLSLGERMKMELIASLLHKPKLLFLDEPTIGLDIVAQEKIRGFLKDFQQQSNTTIILTSHYMGDINSLCERIVLVIEGEKKFDGSISDFESLVGDYKSITIKFEEPLEELKSDEFLSKFSPSWNENFSEVEILIPKSDFRSCVSYISNNFAITNLYSDKLPIEKVLESFLLKAS